MKDFRYPKQLLDYRPIERRRWSTIKYTTKWIHSWGRYRSFIGL